MSSTEFSAVDGIEEHPLLVLIKYHFATIDPRHLLITAIRVTSNDTTLCKFAHARKSGHNSGKTCSDGNKVIISSPYGDRIEDFIKMGCEYREITLNRRGMNPISEIKLLCAYKKLLKEVKPDMVFTYTIKPNIYGAIACRKYKIPCVCNITGLGTAIENKGLAQKICVFLCKI